MITKEEIKLARERLSSVVIKTDLDFCERLSEKYSCEIYLKREDQQKVRSYKIRGAYNLISSLSREEKSRGVVCASAGNHAQGFAFACKELKVKGVVFMPEPTPNQKIDKVKNFGSDFVEIVIHGKTFDDAFERAKIYEQENSSVFVHPFDDERTIIGQATVGLEILEQLPEVDIIVCGIGGGGVSSGIGFYAKSERKEVEIIGCDPAGAPKTSLALANNKPSSLETIDTFVDGAAVKKIGNITFKYIKKYVDLVIEVDEGKVCTSMIELYQNEGIIAEPAGALSVASLDMIQDKIKGKKVVCLISGGNNDISRYPEIIERSLIYEGLKHYYLLELNQKPGQLKKFLNSVLLEDDDITRFEYIKKTNREKGRILLGIELGKKENLLVVEGNMKRLGFSYKKITQTDLAWELLV